MGKDKPAGGEFPKDKSLRGVNCMKQFWLRKHQPHVREPGLALAEAVFLPEFL